MQSGKVYLLAAFLNNSGWKGNLEFSGALLTDSSWVQLSASFTVPQDITLLNVGVRIKPANQNAVIHVDDLALYRSPEDSVLAKPEYTSADRMLMTNEAFGGYLSYLPAYVGQWGYFKVPFFNTFPAGTYKYKIRYFGDQQNSASPSFEIVAGSAHQQIALLPSEADGKFHYAEGSFTVNSPFDTAVIKKRTAGAGLNPIDWVWVGTEDAALSEEQFRIMEPPGNLAAEYVAPSKVQLSWTAPPSQSGIGTYQIYRGSEPGFAANENTLVGNTTECQFTDDMDTAYLRNYYKVVAWNTIYGGNMSPAAQINMLSDNTPPNAASGVTAESLAAGVAAISWQAPNPAGDGDTATVYKIYRLKSGEEIAQVTLVKELTAKDAEFSQCRFFDRGVETGSFRYALVVADKSGLESPPAFSGEVSIVADLYPPQAPVSLDAWLEETPAGQPVPAGTVVLEWHRPAATAQDGDLPTFYNIYRSARDNPRQTGILLARLSAEGKEKVSFLDVTGAGGNMYYYTVISVDKALNESQGASPVRAVRLAVPPFPSALSPVDGTPAVTLPTLEWSGVRPVRDGLSCYLLEIARDSDFQTAITLEVSGTETGGAIQYQLTEQLAAGQWYWRVAVKYESGVQSRYSNVSRFVLLANAQLALSMYTSVTPKFFSPRRGESISLYSVFKEKTEVSIAVYQLDGKLVRRLAERMPVNVNEVYQVRWDGADAVGGKVRNGIYLFLIEAKTAQGQSRQVRRVQVYN